MRCYRFKRKLLGNQNILHRISNVSRHIKNEDRPEFGMAGEGFSDRIPPSFTVKTETEFSSREDPLENIKSEEQLSDMDYMSIDFDDPADNISELKIKRSRKSSKIKKFSSPIDRR